MSWPNTITVTLRDTRDGCTGVYERDVSSWQGRKARHSKEPDRLYTKDEIVYYILFGWAESDFSCDCNRWDFLTQGDSPEPPGMPCSRGHNLIVIDEFLIDGVSYLDDLRYFEG